MKRYPTALAIGLVIGLAHAASAAESCAAGGGAPIDLEQVLMRKGGPVDHVWGKENMSFIRDPASLPGAVLRIAYPARSFSPGQSPVRGGAGFELRDGTGGATSGCLSYKVRFPIGFDFVKGGKLPGLFGGDDPRGCVADDKVTGFSARLMWRAEGAGELYLYAPGRDTRCGQSIGRGAWTFAPGSWTSVTERATLNAPGSADGTIQVWIDGRSVIKAEGLVLSASPESSVDGLLFSTFFGGGDVSWATPHDQTVDFADIDVTTHR